MKKKAKPLFLVTVEKHKVCCKEIFLFYFEQKHTKCFKNPNM